jgi:hypothetical protein
MSRTKPDLWKLVYTIRERLESGVELSDGSAVAVHLSGDHFAYVKVRGNEVKVQYVDRCVNVRVDAVIEGRDVKITNVEMFNCAEKGVGNT